MIDRQGASITISMSGNIAAGFNRRVFREETFEGNFPFFTRKQILTQDRLSSYLAERLNNNTEWAETEIAR